ncbi:hypothetical protein [Pantoea sp. 1.19]|uniref:hypothetical protein n=1 Tax=Pantoea sp. 1.19 TaxID=1925589 RepID=UPI0009491363|nr:hypothetical protein [Pantoea sp. 1.19]
MNMSRIAVLSAAILLAGCAVQNDTTRFHGLGLTYQSDVKALGDGQYQVEVEAAPAAGRVSGATGSANQRAANFCYRQNKSMQPLQTTTDTHLLVNGVARLTFRCV